MTESLMLIEISVTNKMNNSGLKGLPCGTPKLGWIYLLFFPFIFTLNFLSDKKLETHQRIMSGNPNSRNFNFKPACQTLSNAFSMSKNTPIVFSFKLKPFLMYWDNLNNCSLVE